MKIYTKTGDKGETGIIGSRIPKNSSKIHAIGNIDELNSLLGIVISKLELNKTIEVESISLLLIEIQNAIFDIGAILANGSTNRDFKKLTLTLEKEIDNLDSKLEPLQNFILQGGSEISSFIHLARSICRRAERLLVETIYDQMEKSDSEFNKHQEILSFVNRLSDYLFILARYINFKLGYEDIIWGKKRIPTK